MRPPESPVDGRCRPLHYVGGGARRVGRSGRLEGDRAWNAADVEGEGMQRCVVGAGWIDHRNDQLLQEGGNAAPFGSVCGSEANAELQERVDRRLIR